MGDKEFLEYEKGTERRVKLAVTLTNIANHLKTLNSRQEACDEDRVGTRKIAEGAKKKIDGHILISEDREGRGRFTFGKITKVVGLVLAAAAIFVSYLFVTTVHGSTMNTNTASSIVSETDQSLSRTERIDDFIYVVNTNSDTRVLGLKFSCNNKNDERPVLIVKMSRQCLRCGSCEEHVVPIIEKIGEVFSSGWNKIAGSRRINFVNSIGEIVYITDANGRFKKVEKVT